MMRPIPEGERRQWSEESIVIERNRFIRPRWIRSGECDPAGIVFYPHYMQMLHELQVEFFQAALGIDYHHMIRDAGIHVPLVSLNVAFTRPSREGDHVEFVLSLEGLGQTSFKYHVECVGNDGLRLSARMKAVTLNIAEQKPLLLPQLLRNRLERFRSS